MSYEPLPIEEVAVADLHLDRSNYRIDDALPSESAAITYLFTEHDVIGLARQILIEGYVDNELILAVKEDQQYVVLEGNRRTTALKALLDPSIAPGNARETLETLKRRHEIEAEDLPTRVRVMVAPDRTATQMLLARLHVGQSKSGWGRDAQARFVIAQLTAGKSTASIRQDLPGIKNPAGYVRQYHVREILKTAQFADPKLAAYAASSRLKMTSFEYAYGNPEIQEALGLSFDKEGVPTSTPTTERQVRALERLVGLFESGVLNTRRFPKRTSETYQDDIHALIRRLTDVEPSQPPADGERSASDAGASSHARSEPGLADRTSDTDGRSPSPGDGARSGADAGSEAGGGGKRGPDSPDTLKRLHITLEYKHAPAGLRKRINELRSLDLTTHPTATAMLMRSVIEASIKWHFAVRNSPVGAELGRVMPDVQKTYSSEASMKNAIALLQDGSRKNVRAGSLHWFNMAAHDPHQPLPAQDVRDAWQRVEQFVQFMLTPAPAAPSE